MTDNQDALNRALDIQQDTVDRLIDGMAAARPEAVFGEPVQVGDYTLITASEVMAGAGAGYGIGVGGYEPNPDAGGGGGGGGSGSTGRPVALITAGPDGVHIEPIVDLTKIGIALLTTLGSMFLMLRRMSR